MTATVPTYLVAENDPDLGTVITVEQDGEYYRIFLCDVAPDFTAVDPTDTITGPVVFTPDMEAAFTQLEENANSGPGPFAYLSFEEAVLRFFYCRVYRLPAEESVSFGQANEDAIRMSGDYPTAAPHSIPAAKYRWEKAAAAAWRKIKEQLGQ